jgi:hypothetical protein
MIVKEQTAFELHKDVLAPAKNPLDSLAGEQLGTDIITE